MKRFALILIYFGSLIASNTKADPQFAALKKVICAPDNPNVFAVASQRQIWTTTDNGVHFDVTSLRPFAPNSHHNNERTAENADTETNLTAESQAEEIDNSMSQNLQIAINNIGQWAVFNTDRVCFRTDNTQRHRCLKHDTITDVLFDHDDNLWILKTGHLLVLAPPHYTRTLATAQVNRNATGMVLSPDTGVLITTPSGIVPVVRFRTRISTHPVIPLMNLNAVAKAPKGDTVIAVHNRQLTQIVNKIPTHTVPLPLSLTIKKLLSDKNGTVAILTSNDQWHFWLAGRLLFSSSSDIDLTSSGDFLEVGPFGLRRTGNPVGPPKQTHRPLSPSIKQSLPTATYPTPPRCIQRGRLLPKLKWVFSRTVQNRVSPTSSPHIEIWQLMLTAAWSWGPIDLSACIKRWATHQHERQKRTQYRIALINDRARDASATTDTESLIRHRMRIKQKAALIQIHQPIPPRSTKK